MSQAPDRMSVADILKQTAEMIPDPLAPNGGEPDRNLPPPPEQPPTTPTGRFGLPTGQLMPGPAGLPYVDIEGISSFFSGVKTGLIRDFIQSTAGARETTPFAKELRQLGQILARQQLTGEDFETGWPSGRLPEIGIPPGAREVGGGIGVREFFLGGDRVDLDERRGQAIGEFLLPSDRLETAIDLATLGPLGGAIAKTIFYPVRVLLKRVLRKLGKLTPDSPPRGDAPIPKGASDAPVMPHPSEVPAPELVGRVMELPTADELVEATIRFGKVRQNIQQIPGGQAMLDLLSLAQESDAMKLATMLRGKLEDIAEGAVQRAMFPVEGASGARFGRLPGAPPVFPMKNGIVQRVIPQTQPLPGGLLSQAGNDIIEWAPRYNPPPDVRTYVDEVRKVLQEASTYIQKEGIPFRKLHDGESDFVYLHRYVVSVIQDRARDLARDLQAVLLAKHIDLSRASGETGAGYLKRALNDARVRALADKQVDDIAKEISELRQVATPYQRMDRARLYDTASQTLDAGNRISDDMTMQVRATLKLVYQSVIDKRVGEMLRHFTITRSELLEREMPEVAAELLLGKQTAAQAITFLRAVRAIKEIGPARTAERIFKRRIQRDVREAFPIEIARVEDILLLRAKERRPALTQILESLDQLVARKRAISQGLRLRATLTTESLISAETGTLLNVRGLSGRLVPSQIIGGKLVRGDKLGKAIEAQFGYMPKGWLDQVVLIPMVGMAQLYRIGRLAFDLSWGLIQGTGALGLDFHQLMVAPAKLAFTLAGRGALVWPRLSNTFLPAVTHGAWVGIDPRHQLAWWSRPGRPALLAERLNKGGLLQSSEYTEGQSLLKRLVEKVPLAGPLLGKFVGQTYGRMDLAWSFSRNASGQLQYEFMRPLATKPADVKAMGQVGNITTGVFSMSGSGISRNKQQAFSAFGFLAARFTWSQFAYVYSVFKGGMRGSIVRQSILGLIEFNTIFFTLAALALGQKPKLNPLPRSLGGDGADLWTVRIGSDRYGIGGILYSPLRLIAEVAGDLIDDPEQLITFDSEHPLVRWWRGKAPGPMSMLIDYLRGRDFGGDPIRGESFAPTKETAKWLGYQFTPIWYEEMIKEGYAPAVADFQGGRSFPESKWGHWRRLIEEADPENREFDNISRYERVKLEAKYIHIRNAKHEAIQDDKRRGKTPTATEYWQERQVVDEQWGRRINAAEKQYFEDPMFGWPDLARAIQTAGKKRSGGYEVIESNPRYQELIEDFTARELKHDVDMAYRQYKSILHDDNNYDFVQGFPLPILREKLEKLGEEVDPEVWSQVEEWVGSERLKSPYVYQIYLSSQKVLKLYWEVSDVYQAIHPEAVEIMAQVAMEKKNPFMRPEQLESLLADPILKTALEKIRENRLILRTEHPEIDAWLFWWGYTQDFASTEGKSYYRRELLQFHEQAHPKEYYPEPEKVLV